MPKAIHFICHRDDGVNLNRLDRQDDGTWRSYHWAIKEDVAKSVVGGWMYLHATKSKLSEFGGIVKEIELVERPGHVVAKGYAFIVEQHDQGKGQPWRGAKHRMAWNSRPVDMSFEHENSA